MKKTAYEILQKARDLNKLTSLDYMEKLFDSFYEFHGDRLFADDKAVVGGVALLDDIPVTVIGIQKGKNVKDNIYRNFGAASPEGYRKALRLMKQAEKFGRPIITFINTAGAFCGIEAEERGEGEAIARNLLEMSSLKVPIISIIIGEGGSGGALALAQADQVWMLENSIYAILSPEGFASILWKDSSRAKEAADLMRITPEELLEMNIIDKIIEEPSDSLSEEEFISNFKVLLTDNIKQLREIPKEELVLQRYERFRKY